MNYYRKLMVGLGFAFVLALGAVNVYADMRIGGPMIPGDPGSGNSGDDNNDGPQCKPWTTQRERDASVDVENHSSFDSQESCTNELLFEQRNALSQACSEAAESAEKALGAEAQNCQAPMSWEELWLHIERENIKGSKKCTRGKDGYWYFPSFPGEAWCKAGAKGECKCPPSGSSRSAAMRKG